MMKILLRWQESSWREVALETKAQDPLDLLRLVRLCQKIIQKKKKRFGNETHNNTRVGEHNQLIDQTGYLAVD